MNYVLLILGFVCVLLGATAFKEKDYLLTFLAQANRNYLYSSMRSVNNHILY